MWNTSGSHEAAQDHESELDFEYDITAIHSKITKGAFPFALLMAFLLDVSY